MFYIYVFVYLYLYIYTLYKIFSMTPKNFHQKKNHRCVLTNELFWICKKNDKKE